MSVLHHFFQFIRKTDFKILQWNKYTKSILKLVG